ncbi:MAG: D-alanine--D-alanine ligase [bacterium]|nr:D-alanine--D-alanine ligase [bacterium]
MVEKKLHVAVLMGGPSSEYEISIATGNNILSSLDPAKYLAQPVVVTRERKWLVPPQEVFQLREARQSPGVTALVALEESQALAEALPANIDVAFIAMHGEFGEDGTLQGLLETAGIPYTGPGVLAAALGMDKPRSAAVFRDAGLHVPDFLTVSRRAWRRDGERLARRAEKTFGLPMVIKPANRGSSVGVTIAVSRADIEPGMANAFRYAATVLLQRYIAGVEISCGVLETERGATALPPTEIVPRESQFFDYHAKYTPGASEEITPARLPPEIMVAVQQAALVAHCAIGCRGMSRTDMILDRYGGLWVLEINTIPGLSEMSILPQQAKAAGISFPSLLDYIIAAAIRRKHE